MFSPVLNEQDLATLLKVPGKTVEALVARTDLPRFFVEGKMRFLLSRVLAWCEQHDGRDLLPPLAPEPPPPPPPPPVRPPPPKLPSVKPGEHMWFDDDVLDALESGASDPGRNLDRLKLRDALLELNDALLGTLSRYSGGRLHPHHDERLRTSPWRIDLGTDQRIDDIGIAWGAGEHAQPGFADRPHIEVRLDKGTLELVLQTVGRPFTPPLDDAGMAALDAAGFTLEAVADPAHPGASRPTKLSKLYALPSPPPPVSAVVATLEGDLERLVPLWSRLV